MMQLSKKSIQAIIGFEVTSEDYYNAHYLYPTWPGGDSGITVGIGYDLGMNKRETIIMDWTANVNLNFVYLMANLAGITGEAAKGKCVGLVKNITVPYASAYNVFINNTLQRYCKSALKIYPGLDKLNPDTQGAIVSLVYNRGNSLSGERRTEMNELVHLIAIADYPAIAGTIRRMTRLWEGNGLDGLITRRNAEADMVIGSVTDTAQQFIDAIKFFT